VRGDEVTLTYVDLRIVNGKVNMLPYTSDPEKYKRPEFWEVADCGGDCEDFALAKLQRLKAMGMPIAQMRLATAFVERSFAPEKRDRYHAVLLCDLPGQATYVLDNRYPYPMEHDILPYEWHKLQVAGTREWDWAKDADRSFG
jgi:predicted transglutaminase-like cysteine proteinase